MNPGKLYLIPLPIGGNNEKHLSPEISQVVKTIKFYAVENIRTSRRFISSLKLGINIEDLKFEVLDKNTPSGKIKSILAPLNKGHDVGIMSEAGCPGIADPGSLAVSYAHKKGIKVIPLVGPSSILLALMASGFNGQSFVFHGYIPIDKNQRKQKIKEMEKASKKLNQTQIFMDTPYRNNQLLHDLLSNCHDHTEISVATEVNSVNEFIATHSVKSWRQLKVDLHKRPTIFCLL